MQEKSKKRNTDYDPKGEKQNVHISYPTGDI